MFCIVLAFISLVFFNGMIDGWDRQAEVDTKDWSIAEGQFWNHG